MGFFDSIWHKHLGGQSAPWADISYVDGAMRVKAYNKAFVNKLIDKLGVLTDGKTDDEIVNLFVSRENIKAEEPRLDVKHSGITEDGRIKMELDWNSSFIHHLAENGITAETEDEAVQKYLSLLTHKVADDITTDMLSREDVDAAFHDLDEEAAAELAEAARQVSEHKAYKRNNR